MSDLVTESFIDGASVSSAETYPNIDPSTGAALGDVARAGDKEIDQAVTAARRASRRVAGHHPRAAVRSAVGAGRPD